MTAIPGLVSAVGRRVRAIDLATYRIETHQTGPQGRLDVNRPELAPPDLAAWLADRLEGLRDVPGRHERTGVAWFAAQISVDDGAPGLAEFGFGPHPAPDDWPRMSLRDLLDAGAAELRRA